MKPRNLLIYALFCLALAAGAVPILAQGNKAGADMAAELLEQGWQQVADGVLQLRDGTKIKTFALGVEGLRWVLQDLENQLGVLLKQYRAAPSDELWKTIEAHQAEMARVQKEIEAAATGTSQPEPAIGCNFSYGANGDAYPLGGQQGVAAWANAYFYNDCYYWGYVYAYVSVTASNTNQTYSESQQGYNTSAYASLALAGGPYCESYAYSSVDWAGAYLAVWDQNFECPAPPPDVWISGPTYVFLRGYQCRSVTWNAVSSGGVPPYSYQWYLNGYPAGNGSSLSEFYCGSGYYDYYEDQVSVTLTDSAGGSDSDTIWVGIESTSECLGYLPICEPY